MEIAGVENRRWNSLLRRVRRENERTSAADEAEISRNSSTEHRNNRVETSEDSSDSPSKTPTRMQSVQSTESLSEDVLSVEKWMLWNIRQVTQIGRRLWRNDNLWQAMAFCGFVCLCVSVGLVVRHTLSPPSLHVHHFLRALDLEEYFMGLSEMGYDHLEDLVWAEEEDLLNAGISLKAHRRRILRRTQMMRRVDYPWILWSILAIPLLWTLISAAFFVYLLRYVTFREKCKRVAVWLSFTLW